MGMRVFLPEFVKRLAGQEDLTQGHDTERLRQLELLQRLARGDWRLEIGGTTVASTLE